jgi:glycosyltransferase involved in cell wall biosynthesis
MHGFTNLYCTLAAVPFGAVSLGALRNELDLLITRHGRWALWLLRLPDALIVNSEHLLQEVKSDGRMSNLSLNLLPNCIDVGNYRTPASPRRVDEPMAIFVARLVSSKRLDLFLEALSLARKSNLSLRGTVLGDGPELRAMKRRATELGLVPDGVHFVGHCPDPVPWLCKATVMVFCSESEGSPNVILEAMAAGLPVITTAAGDAAAIVEDGTTGYVVPFNDARALADRILAVSASPRLQRRLGEFGRQVVEQRYDIQTLGDRLLSIYHLIARERGKGRALRAFPSHCGAYPINE